MSKGGLGNMMKQVQQMQAKMEEMQPDTGYAEIGTAVPRFRAANYLRQRDCRVAVRKQRHESRRASFRQPAEHYRTLHDQRETGAGTDFDDRTRGRDHARQR